MAAAPQGDVIGTGRGYGLSLAPPFKVGGPIMTDSEDYDMDSLVKKQQAAAGGRATKLTGQTVVTSREAHTLAGRSGLADHILAAVYDYWLNERLATQQPL
jgi:hypothetical protein